MLAFTPVSLTTRHQSTDTVIDEHVMTWSSMELALGLELQVIFHPISKHIHEFSGNTEIELRRIGSRRLFFTTRKCTVPVGYKWNYIVGYENR